jgi:SEC-C motif-containing protein
MRSRYSAFALGLTDYLLASWHPATRPRDLALDHDLTWRRLQIVDTVAGTEQDLTGIVEFRAAYRGAHGAGLLHERSLFERDGGRWSYRGEVAGDSTSLNGRGGQSAPQCESGTRESGTRESGT